MARNSAAAQNAATSAQNLSNTYAGNAANVFSALEPQLMAEATHPAGMSPTDLAAADTAAQQSAGGTEAATVGQGGLLASRTRNAGGAGAAIASGARSAGRNLSMAALGTRLKNAGLKVQERMSGLSGLGNLFSESAGAGNQASGQIANDVNANTNQQKESWDWTQGLNSISKALSPEMLGF